MPRGTQIDRKHPLLQHRKIVLASRSVARRALLRDAGLKIDLAFADIDESRLKGESIDHYALRVATEKSLAVSTRFKDAVIIAVDTVIVLGGKIYGKPASEIDAARTLKRLSGRWHEVHSGTVFLDTKTGKIVKRLVRTRVKFLRLTGRQIDWYVSTGEPLRAAGGYSIQDSGAALIEEVDGCYSNVVGVSVSLVMKILKRLKAI